MTTRAQGILLHRKHERQLRVSNFRKTKERIVEQVVADNSGQAPPLSKRLQANQPPIDEDAHLRPPRLDSAFEETMNWTKDNFTVSTDKTRLNLDVIHGFLRTSYWAASRTRNEIERTIDNSICFGLYDGERQIGFARLVTDEVVISWLGDVFVIPEFQKKGLGKWLMECVVSHPVTKRTKCLLGTRDAHGLYEKYGWNRKEGMSRPEENEDSNQSCHTTPAIAPR